MTLSRVRLLNFRQWTTEHWAEGIALRPITLFLGRNSAGKTSILQPLRMVKQTLEATDDGIHLELGAGASDGVQLGGYSDVVHDHDESLRLGVGIDVEGGVGVDVEFAMVNKRPVIATLTYRLGEERVTVERTERAYQLASPRFRLPNWDGNKDVHVAKQSYEPGRAIEFSEQALSDLGPTLGPMVRAAMNQVKDAFKTFHYLGPLRPPPSREVVWSQQDLKRLGSTGAGAVQALIGAATGRSKLLAEVSAWLKRLDLADAIEVTRLGTSMLYQLEIVRGEHRSNLVDVGYGVSQVLPLIVLLHFVPEGSVILCEDPEAHLHPMAQAVLADLLVEVAHSRRLQVLVETHSEHLFRRLQYLMAAGTVRSDACGLYYVERAEAAGSKLVQMQADEFGRIREWPENVFGDALGELERQTRKVFERKRAAGETPRG